MQPLFKTLFDTSKTVGAFEWQMAKAWKTAGQKLNMLWRASAALHFLGIKSPKMGKKGSSKVFLPIFINVRKAEDSLNSVVAPWASTIMTESLLPYTSQE